MGSMSIETQIFTFGSGAETFVEAVQFQLKELTRHTLGKAQMPQVCPPQGPFLR
jgi:hypothetical protein